MQKLCTENFEVVSQGGFEKQINRSSISENQKVRNQEMIVGNQRDLI